MLVDRLEELLAMLENEEEKEEEDREDAPALTGRTVPTAVFPEEDDGETAPALTGRTALSAVSTEEDHGETASAGDTRREAAPEPPADAPERMAGEPAEAEGSGPDEGWPDGPVWRLDAGAAERAEAAWRRASAERLDRGEELAAQAAYLAAEEAAETAEAHLSAEKGGELARTIRRETRSGLEGLYRQTVQAVRPAAPARAPDAEQTGWAARVEEPGHPAALTADELDRAMRRDSRRYDGGMTIF